MCQSGKLTPEITEKFKEAVDFLEKKGVSGITGDCGFYMWFQVCFCIGIGREEGRG